MTTYLFIGLILLLAVYLVRARRARSAAGDGAPKPARRPSLRRRKSPAPAPVPAVEAAPAPAAFGPRPLEPALAWEPGETIVEPGWPLPGEIAGTWSPPLDMDGSPSHPAPALAPMAVVEWTPDPLPAPDPAPDAAADLPSAGEWVMPALDPAPSAPLWVPGQDDDPAPDDHVADAAPAWIDPAPIEVAATLAEAQAAPEAPAADAAAGDADDAPAPDMPELAWLGEAPPAEEPAWLSGLDSSPDPAAPADPPPSIAWLPAAPEEPVVESEPEPVVESEPEPVIEPEPEPVAEEAPALAWAVPAEEPPTASLDDQAAEVAALVGTLADGLVPFRRIPDRLGVTPRMLALMRELSEEPRTVTDQARRLGVSRPAVADLCSRLVVLGLATREPMPGDRRRVLVTLTPAGRRAVADAAVAASPADVAEALAGLPATEREALVSGLRALRSR